MNASFWKKAYREGDVELTIGRYFLNRIGILSLVAGFAFFIAYSFQFIGAWGKIAVGFAAAGGLLGLGKHIERKPGLQWYGFGLIGGGWALAYFTTFAMHHIDTVRVLQDPHLALLSLVLVTSVLMADLFRYRSEAITTVVFLLGFFTAGIGRVTSFSLVYAALLTFSLLLVIHKMKWNRLLIFGVLASYATHVFWLGPEILLSASRAMGSLEVSRFALSAGFLVLYGALYGLAPLLVKEEGQDDRRVQTTVTLFSALLVSTFLFREAEIVNPAWRYWIALGLAAFFAAASGLAKYAANRRHLVIANLSLAILFVTISFPLKFTDRWVDVAWLVEIPALLLLGFYFDRIVYRAFAWGLAFVMSMKVLALYDPYIAVHTVQIFPGWLTERSMIVWIAVLAFTAAQAVTLAFRGRVQARDGENGVGRLFLGMALVFLFCLSSFDLTANLISIGWAAVAALFFVAGFGFGDRWFRYAALALVALVVGRVVLHDLRDLPTLYRIVLFMGMGVALLAASFVYGKLAIAKNGEAAR